MDPFPYWIGYDAREKEAFDVAMFSAQRKSSIPLLTRALKARDLRGQGFYTRESYTDNGIHYDVVDGRPFSTEFAFTRFLVPALQNYSGWALFTDCDVLWLDDIGALAAERNNKYAAMVVKHDHVPDTVRKMDGQIQTYYPRKNWSSVILWNCGHKANKVLTPRVVNTQTGQYLHRFSWLADNLIGSLDPGWNFLVGYSKRPKVKPRLMHYTEGGPWFEATRDCPFADKWTNAYYDMIAETGRF